MEKEDCHYRKWIYNYSNKSYLDRAQAQPLINTVMKAEPVKEGACYVTTTIQYTVLPINFVIEKDCAHKFVLIQCHFYQMILL